MKPTIPWMSQTFDEYNKKYFGCKLQMPKFSVNCSDNNWGYYTPNGTFSKLNRKFTKNGTGTIQLNSNYSRDEKDWIGTLLHEMIHMYINEVMLLYPKNPHGKEFIALANRLNADGWNISEGNEKKDTDVYEPNNNNSTNRQENVNKQNYSQQNGEFNYIFCIIEQPKDKNFKLWGFRADETNLDEYINTAKILKEKNGATTLKIFITKAKQIGYFPLVPSKLNGCGADGIYRLFYRITQSFGGYIDESYFQIIKEIQL
jgi:hypothetical protein